MLIRACVILLYWNSTAFEFSQEPLVRDTGARHWVRQHTSTRQTLVVLLHLAEHGQSPLPAADVARHVAAASCDSS
jgi:hypothetical protein